VYTSKTHELISVVHEQRQGTGFRRHLGASLIGRKCPRQLWYVFRWARRSSFAARLLRLFERGEREEPVLVSRLRSSGIHVLDRDPATGNQFRIEDHNGHFGGSLDALIYDSPDYPGIWVLGEFKTHGDKSFQELVRKGLKESKWEHVVQQQIYMRYMGLPASLYFAVNKNDDDIYTATVEFDPSVAEQYIDRANKIINSLTPPERISNSPGWFLCKWCDLKDVCHHGTPKEVNCRTCVYSRPIENAQWLCTRYNYILTEPQQRLGCTMHQMIPED
jgi:hypothetical protein